MIRRLIVRFLDALIADYELSARLSRVDAELDRDYPRGEA